MNKRNASFRKRMTAWMMCGVLGLSALIPARIAQAEDVMQATSVCVQGKKADTPEVPAESVMQAASVGLESGNAGEDAAKVTMTDDGPWWGASQATVKVGEAVTPLGDRKSVVIHSEINEGYAGSYTTPVFHINADWYEMNMDTQDFMFYVKLPATGSSLYLTNVEMDNFSFYPALSGMKYKYLSVYGGSWQEETVVNSNWNNLLDLPDGFEGYVRLQLNTASNYSSARSNILKLQQVAFRLDAFGGDLGDAVIGGSWIVEKQDKYYLSVDGATGKDMLKDEILAHAVGTESGTLNEKAEKVYIERDDKWWGIDTQAEVTIGEPITPISDRKSSVINSAVKEGYDNHTAPSFRINADWQSINPDTQDFMFYVKLPRNASSLRLTAISLHGWSYYPNIPGLKYKYLAVNGNAWKSGTVSTEGNRQLDLPEGFEGYIRLQLDSADNHASRPAKTMTMQFLEFYVSSFGGDLGEAVVGGSWIVLKNDATKIRVDGGGVVSMVREDGENEEPEEPEDISLDVCENWWGATKRSTIALGEKTAPIGVSKSVVIDSATEEGTAVSKSAQSIKISPKCDIAVGKQDLMLYVELPKIQKDSTELRMIDFRNVVEDTWGNYKNGKTAEYLAVDGTKWVSIRSNEDGSLSLPDGFKGYIKLHPEQISSWNNLTGKHNLDFFRFYLGGYGGKYGSVKIGGVWIVSKSNSIQVSVDGGETQCLSTYYKNNEVWLTEYQSLVGQLNEKSPEAAGTIDRLQVLYQSMSKEYRDKVTAEEAAKVREYTEAVKAYRTSLIGVSIRPQGSDPQGFKIGWNLDASYLKKAGYTVVSSGAVAMYEKDYAGDPNFTQESANSISLNGNKSTKGYYYAVMDIKEGYETSPILIRSYAVVENDATKEQITIWCNQYCDKKSQNNNYMKCSLADAASYFKISLKAK